MKRIKVRFAPGTENQIQVLLPENLIEKIKDDGANDGRDFSQQVRWLLSKSIGVKPLAKRKMLTQLRQEAENRSLPLSTYIRELLTGKK